MINVGVAGLILLLQHRLPPQIPLFYGNPAGEEQLVGRIWLILPPIVSVLITAINSAGCILIKDSYLQKVLIGTTIAVTTLSTITIAKILFLVGWI